MSQFSPAFLEVKYQCLACKKKRWVEGCVLQEIGRWEGLPVSELPVLKCPFCHGVSLPLGNIIGTSKSSVSTENSFGIESLHDLLQLQKV